MGDAFSVPFILSGMNLSVSEAKLTGYVCVVGNVLLFNSRFRFSNLPSDPKSYRAFRGVNGPQEPVEPTDFITGGPDVVCINILIFTWTKWDESSKLP